MSLIVRRQVGRNVTTIRILKGLSQAELARRTKMSVSQLNRIERTAQNLTIDLLVRLAKSLGVPVSHLLARKIDEKLEGQEVDFDVISEALKSLKRSTELLETLKP